MTCKRTGGEPLRFNQEQPALDLVISDRLFDVICPCNECSKTFSRVKKLIQAIENRDDALKHLENNLEGEVN